MITDYEQAEIASRITLALKFASEAAVAWDWNRFDDYIEVATKLRYEIDEYNKLA